MVKAHMFRRLNESISRFMYGRYGYDKLNMTLLITGLAITLLGNFTRLAVLTTLAWIPLILFLYRMFSRNVARRRQENQKFLQFFTRLRDRQNRYFSCPQCRQTVRVPRGRGKISIRCPKCGKQFIKKT